MKKLETKLRLFTRWRTGGAIAKAFAREGAKVFLTGRTLTKLSSLTT